MRAPVTGHNDRGAVPQQETSAALAWLPRHTQSHGERLRSAAVRKHEPLTQTTEAEWGEPTATACREDGAHSGAAILYGRNSIRATWALTAPSCGTKSDPDRED